MIIYTAFLVWFNLDPAGAAQGSWGTKQICCTFGNPVFTINGLCNNNVFDINYYLITDEKNTINYYADFFLTK